MIIKEYSCTADTAAFRRKMFVLNFCKNQSENFILFLLQYKKDLKVSLMTNIPVPIVQILIDLRKNIYFPNLIRARDILPSFLILFAFKYIPQHACNLAPPPLTIPDTGAGQIYPLNNKPAQIVGSQTVVTAGKE